MNETALHIDKIHGVFLPLSNNIENECYYSFDQFIQLYMFFVISKKLALDPLLL